MAKLALITGASAGIGREACALFARKGYRVIALSRQPIGVEFSELEMALDLESFEQIEGLADALDSEIASAERFILVCNSGYGQFGGFRACWGARLLVKRQYGHHTWPFTTLGANTMRLQDLIDEASALPVDERALVVESLLKSLNPIEANIEKNG